MSWRKIKVFFFFEKRFFSLSKFFLKKIGPYLGLNFFKDCNGSWANVVSAHAQSWTCLRGRKYSHVPELQKSFCKVIPQTFWDLELNITKITSKWSLRSWKCCISDLKAGQSRGSSTIMIRSAQSVSNFTENIFRSLRHDIAHNSPSSSARRADKLLLQPISLCILPYHPKGTTRDHYVVHDRPTRHQYGR